MVARPNIQPLSSVTESINMLVYGDPGCGKTVLAGTAPKSLMIAVDPGTVSAGRSGSAADVYRPTDWKDFIALFSYLEKEAHGYEWVTIDSLTELQHMALIGILTNPADGKKRDIDTPQIQDYGKWQNMFKRMVKRLNDAPFNVLYTAHAIQTEDMEGEQIVLPDINGKNGTNDPTTMSRWVCGTMHVYGYLKVNVNAEKAEYRRLICRRAGPYFGKDRYGVLAPYVDNPNMAEITARILAPVK